MKRNIYDVLQMERPPETPAQAVRRKQIRRLKITGVTSAMVAAAFFTTQYFANKEHNALLRLMADNDQIHYSGGLALHLNSDVEAALRKEAQALIATGKNWERSKVLPNAVIEHRTDCHRKNGIETCVTLAHATPHHPLVNPEDRKRHLILDVFSFPISYQRGPELRLRPEPN